MPGARQSRRERFSVGRDLAWSMMMFMGLLLTWTAAAATDLGRPDDLWKALDDNNTMVLGALFTAAGFLSRQYALNEVLSYLAKRALYDLAVNALANAKNLTLQKRAKLAEKTAALDRHRAYIDRELFILAYVPVVLVGLMGTATVAGHHSRARIAALLGLTFTVCYLTRTVATSYTIARERIRLEQDSEQFQRSLLAHANGQRAK